MTSVMTPKVTCTTPKRISIGDMIVRHDARMGMSHHASAGRQSPADEAGHHQNQAHETKEVDRGDVVVLRIESGEVEEDFGNPSQAILGFPLGPWVMLDRNLFEACSRPGDVDGKKPVHLAVERNLSDVFRFVGSKGAAVVMHTNIGEARDQALASFEGSLRVSQVSLRSFLHPQTTSHWSSR